MTNIRQTSDVFIEDGRVLTPIIETDVRFTPREFRVLGIQRDTIQFYRYQKIKMHIHFISVARARTSII